MRKKIYTILVLASISMLFVGGQALAHTGFRDKTGVAGVASYNGFTITHGCDDYAASAADPKHKLPYPVIGQIALFPYGTTAVWRNAATKAIVPQPTNLTGTFSLSPTGYNGFSSAFSTSAEIVDELGNVHALKWGGGAMEPNMNTIPTFKITPPKFNSQCIKSIAIRAAIINYCDVGKDMANDDKGPYKAPKDAFGKLVPKTINGTDAIQQNVTSNSNYTGTSKSNGPNNRADWWFRDLVPASTLYTDQSILGEAGLWSAVFTVTPESTATACSGTAIDYIVEPSGTDVDTYFNATNTRPYTTGQGPF